jgi:hypothetical protein
MPHVQHACHIGGRDDDRIGFLRGINGGSEKMMTFPVPVPLLFSFLRAICLR